MDEYEEEKAKWTACDVDTWMKGADGACSYCVFDRVDSDSSYGHRIRTGICFPYGLRASDIYFLSLAIISFGFVYSSR